MPDQLLLEISDATTSDLIVVMIILFLIFVGGAVVTGLIISFIFKMMDRFSKNNKV